MQAHRGEVKVTITTAQPLEKDLQKRLEDALKSSQVAQSGKNLVFENKINEAQLGGVVIDVGDKTIDLSVASRVSRLNQQLEGPFPPLLLCAPLVSVRADHSGLQRASKRHPRCDRARGVETVPQESPVGLGGVPLPLACVIEKQWDRSRNRSESPRALGVFSVRLDVFPLFTNSAARPERRLGSKL